MGVVNSEHSMLTLTRYVSQGNLNAGHLPTKIDVGIKIKNRPIYFAKYKFDSNDTKMSVYQYLKADEYVGSQYIGFFDNTALTEENRPNLLKFINASEIIFTFALSDISNKLKVDFVPNEYQELGTQDYRAVKYKPNTFQYLTPGMYYEKMEDDRELRHSGYAEGYKNSGEYDIVARTEVFGLAFGVGLFNIFEQKHQTDLNSESNLEIMFEIISRIHSDTYLNLSEKEGDEVLIPFKRLVPPNFNGINLLFYILYLLNDDVTKDIALNVLQTFNDHPIVKKNKTKKTVKLDTDSILERLHANYQSFLLEKKQKEKQETKEKQEKKEKKRKRTS